MKGKLIHVNFKQSKFKRKIKKSTYILKEHIFSFFHVKQNFHKNIKHKQKQIY